MVTAFEKHVTDGNRVDDVALLGLLAMHSSSNIFAKLYRDVSHVHQMCKCAAPPPQLHNVVVMSGPHVAWCLCLGDPPIGVATHVWLGRFGSASTPSN
jgi:hypothetical protein